MSRIARILGQLRPQSAAVSTGAAFSDDFEPPASAHVGLAELTNGLARLTVGGTSSDLTRREAQMLSMWLAEVSGLVLECTPAYDYLSPGSKRVDVMPGEKAPCPLCAHPIDAHEAELYGDAVYIDSASQLAKYLEAKGMTTGLQVRGPTFTAPGAPNRQTGRPVPEVTYTPPRSLPPKK